MSTPKTEAPIMAATPTEPPNSVGSGSELAQQLYPLIAEQPFFKGLSSSQLKVLADSAMPVEFKPEESIFREGAPANRFYIMGDNLGWSWLFPPYYLHSSARAIEPVKTLFFYGTRLQQQCEADHELGYELMKRIAEVLIQSLHATQQRLMESTHETDLNT